MTWKQEHKDNMQSHYGGYCEMCRQMGEEPVPYHKFNADEYQRIKLIIKN